MRIAIIAFSAAAAALAVPVPAWAASPLELVGYVQIERTITDDKGESRIERIDPERVLPGERLIFGTRYANAGAAPVENFVVSNPVPAAVSVAADVSPALTVSVDGGKTWGRLTDLQITDPGGETRPALPGDISHVRWIIPQVAPGASGQLEFPVTVR
jgi:uncharacterized repeat protein (TIGR01451 family)